MAQVARRRWYFWRKAKIGGRFEPNLPPIRELWQLKDLLLAFYVKSATIHLLSALRAKGLEIHALVGFRAKAALSGRWAIPKAALSARRAIPKAALSGRRAIPKAALSGRQRASSGSTQLGLALHGVHPRLPLQCNARVHRSVLALRAPARCGR